MAENSKIEWTDHTFNPWIGCTKVDELCRNCYAETLMDTRYGRVKWGNGQPRLRTSVSNWKEPLKWNREAPNLRLIDGTLWIHGGSSAVIGNPESFRINGYEYGKKLKEADRRELTQSEWDSVPPYRPRVFCASLADWLDDEVPIEWLADLLKLIHDTPNLDWLLLTKRPENFFARIQTAWRMMVTKSENEKVGLWAAHWELGTTIPENIWLGTSVGTQKSADERIPELLKIPAKVRFLSCEPLLENVNLPTNCLFTNLGDPSCCTVGSDGCFCANIHWVICGGESGPGARPMHPDWARSLRDQCTSSGVPFLFKQWGEWLPHCQDSAEVISYGRNQFHPFDENHQSYRVGKKATGRLLDGREWNEFPAH